jgi:hypothetical protein
MRIELILRRHLPSLAMDLDRITTSAYFYWVRSPNIEMHCELFQSEEILTNQIFRTGRCQ